VEQLESRRLLSDGLGGDTAAHCLLADSTDNGTADVAPLESARAIASARAAVARNHEGLGNFAGNWNITTGVGNGTAALTQNGKKVGGTVQLIIGELGQVTLNVKANVKGGALSGKGQVNVPGVGTIKIDVKLTMPDPPNGVTAAGTAKVKIPGQPAQQNVVVTMNRVV
jgi:hypothetical protein